MILIFQKAIIEDAEEIFKLHKLFCKKERKELDIKDKNMETIEEIINKIYTSIFYKIIIDDKIIGTIHGKYDGNENFNLNNICINPEYENLGIEINAIKFIENEYRKNQGIYCC